MPETEIRHRTKRLFSIHKLEPGDGLRRTGAEGSHVPDIHRDDRVSDWLARHFDRHGIRLNQKNDIAIQVDDNEWRIIQWPEQAYAYRVERQGQTLCIYLSEHPHMRVLALDAGGIAGYFNARLLQKVHERVREKVLQFQEAFRRHKASRSLAEQNELNEFEDYINNLQINFLDDVDFLMGTSAGSVNAAILAQDDKPTNQLAQCINVWREPRLFDNEPLSNLLAIYGLRSFVSFTKYKKSLSKFIPADLPLKALKKDALFTTFALDPKDDSPRSKPKIFNSAAPEDENELTLDVVLRSGSAVPLGAIHQGYADGGWYSPSPTTHILPLFRWFTELIAAEQKKLQAPLKQALQQDWFVDLVPKPLHTGVRIDHKNNYLSFVAALNQGVLPDELHLPFFADAPTHDLRGATTVQAFNEGPPSNDTFIAHFTCRTTQFRLIIHPTGNDMFAVELAAPDEKDETVFFGDTGLNIIEVTQVERDALLTALRDGKLPAVLQKAYFDEPPEIDFALHPVDIYAEQRFQWRVETIEAEPNTPRKFRIKATPEKHGDLFSFEWLSHEVNTKKLEQLIDTLSTGHESWDAYMKDLFDMCKEREDPESHKLLHDHALNFLIHQNQPPTKLSLLSVGIGIKNKRLVMPRDDYHWGYLHMMVPSLLNQQFSLGSAMASAQADRATEEIRELDRLYDDLNFHRLDPGVLSFNRFAYSAAAIFPPFKDAVIAQLELDLAKPEVKDEVEDTAEWIFRYWILGDQEYQTLTDGSSARPRFPTEANAQQPITVLTRLPGGKRILPRET